MEMTHVVAAAYAPTHASPFQSLGHHALARTLHRTTPDLPAVSAVPLVVHFVLMVAKVTQLYARHLAAIVAPRTRIKLFQQLQHGKTAGMLERVAP